MDFISSTNNSLIKNVQRLDKKRERHKTGLFLVEGIREITLAAKSGIAIDHLLVNQKWNEANLQSFIEDLDVEKNTQVQDDIFSKISYRGSVANALAICRIKTKMLNELVLPSNAVVLILESLEKPGNIGAIFRSADASGVDAIVVANPNTDILNPNIVRSSLGSLFTVPFATGSNDEILKWLVERKFNIVATWLEASSSHFEADYSGNTAIVMGSEAFGITPFWQENAHKTVKIPMRGEVDSMNVSTATAVVLYESVRQRM
jgi:RNA methyltransferase, TrmH family